MFAKFSLSQKIILFIAISIAASTTVLAIIIVKDVRNDVLKELFFKAKAIARMAENARNATGNLVSKNAFNTEVLLAEAQKSLAGLKTGSPEFFNKLRETTYYNTIPVVSAFNAALKGAEESHFKFKPTRFDARNPEYVPVTDMEKSLLQELQSTNAGEISGIDEVSNSYRYFRAVKLSQECLVCHGNANDDPTRPNTIDDPLGFKKDNKKNGDLHGAFQVIMELEPIDEHMRKIEIEALIITLVTIFFASLVVAYIIRKSVIRPIETISNELAGGAEQVNSAATQVSESSQSLASGASEQASSLEETSSSLEQISTMTKQNAENASMANSLMKNSRTSVDTGVQSMNEVVQSMDSISKSSGEMSKIIKVIEEIAFQTNLLALNAAVEAARAGEHGKGFAVVAEEVRNLAQRSASASKDTAILIENAVTQAGTGSNIVKKASEALKTIEENVKKAGDLISEIATASNEQAMGVNQVNQAVSQMDKVTQQNAATAEESASAAEEMSAQAYNLLATIDGLNVIIHGGNSNGNNRDRRLNNPTTVKKLTS
ncbi:MAG: methyl-accepting chemotaxis protein [Nitrospinota bacterium]|nr:methyl-accepting chemotaxis protein [Nitrospinota bacterium]